jgi:hypothetical protein
MSYTSVNQSPTSRFGGFSAKVANICSDLLHYDSLAKAAGAAYYMYKKRNKKRTLEAQIYYRSSREKARRAAPPVSQYCKEVQGFESVISCIKAGNIL